MTIISKKSRLIELIQQTKDDKAIAFALELFEIPKEVPVESWQDTPEILREGIEEGIEEADAGELTPHKEVVAMFREKYKE